MRAATRFPFQRIIEFDRAIRAGEYPNATTFARSQEVCSRTIQRDIEFFCERLGAPLVFDRKRNGYTYKDPNYRLPAILLTEGELVALFVAERVLRQYCGTPFGADLERAFLKIQVGLNDRISLDLGRLSESYSFHNPPALPFEESLFRDLAAAIDRRCRIVIDYWTASRQEETRRAVDPYHLASIQSEWYLIGHCHFRNAIRSFAPSRIRRWEMTDSTFEIPADFRIEEYLRDSFGAILGAPGELHQVVIRFQGLAVRYVSERTWHRSQTIETNDNGDLVVSLRVSHLREVERWVLSWGADAEVLEPPELRDRVAAIARETAAQYLRPPNTVAITQSILYKNVEYDD